MEVKKGWWARCTYEYNPGGRGGGTPLYLLYEDMPLDGVWFSGIPVLNRVYNLCVCVLILEQGIYFLDFRASPLQ